LSSLFILAVLTGDNGDFLQNMAPGVGAGDDKVESKAKDKASFLQILFLSLDKSDFLSLR
jgi:hypothetical protein